MICIFAPSSFTSLSWNWSLAFRDGWKDSFIKAPVYLSPPVAELSLSKIFTTFTFSLLEWSHRHHFNSYCLRSYYTSGTKSFTCIILFNSYSNSTRLFSFYRWGNWDTKRLNKFPKTKEQRSGRIRIQIVRLWTGAKFEPCREFQEIRQVTWQDWGGKPETLPCLPRKGYSFSGCVGGGSQVPSHKQYLVTRYNEHL